MGDLRGKRDQSTWGKMGPKKKRPGPCKEEKRKGANKEKGHPWKKRGECTRKGRRNGARGLETKGCVSDVTA